MTHKTHDKLFSVGCGQPSALNVKHRALHESAISLGYRSFSHLRTEGKEDLTLCYSEALDSLCEAHIEYLYEIDLH